MLFIAQVYLTAILNVEKIPRLTEYLPGNPMPFPRARGQNGTIKIAGFHFFRQELRSVWKNGLKSVPISSAAEEGD